MPNLDLRHVVISVFHDRLLKKKNDIKMRWCKNKQEARLNTEVVKSWEEVRRELKGAEEKE